MRIHITSLALASVAALVLSACSSGGGDSAAGETGSIVVSAFTKSPVSTIDQMVVRMGFLEDEGVEAELLEIPSGPDMVASLLGGSAQVTGGSPALIYPLLDQGECLRYLGPGMGNMYNLIARDDANIPGADQGFPASLKGLEGKTIGIVARGSATEIWARAMLEDAGVNPDDVTFIAVGGAPTALPAFQEGQVDAMLSYPPLNQMLTADGVDYTFLTDTANGSPDTLSQMLQVGSVTTCDFADKNPETVNAYCRAVQTAHEFMRDEANEPEMIAFMSEILGVDQPMATEIWSEIKTSFPSDTFTQELFEAQMAFLPDLDETPDYAKAMQPDCG